MAFVKLFNIKAKGAVPFVTFRIQKTTGLSLRSSNELHLNAIRQFPAAAALQLPNNVVDINSSEVGRFSPLRDRDFSGPAIIAHYLKTQDMIGKIDVTLQADPHVNSYDCKGAVNLSSSMQSNVPSPFSGNHSHLGMPGSQWGQGHKYLSEHLHSSHYLTLRNQYRGLHSGIYKFNALEVRNRKMSTSEQDKQETALSSTQKLKNMVKDYGSTVIVFHVTISLISLGGCYLLVSSGIDVQKAIEYFGFGEGALSKQIASNAGTFVVAYAVHKVFAPARMAITLTATPFIVRHLRKIGILKNSVTTK